MIVYSYSLFADAKGEIAPKYKLGIFVNFLQVREAYGEDAAVAVYCDSAAHGWLQYQYGGRLPERVSSFDVGKSKIANRYLWRLLACERFDAHVCARDADSRITGKEVLAVKEWLSSDYDFHAMRDNRHHGCRIMGGMFGVRRGAWADVRNDISVVAASAYGSDQTWLADAVYPRIVRRTLVHTSTHRYEGENCRSFPESDDRFHVGEVVGF